MYMEHNNVDLPTKTRKYVSGVVSVQCQLPPGSFPFVAAQKKRKIKEHRLLFCNPIFSHYLQTVSSLSKYSW